jgi:hypothetical protein
MDLNKKRKDWEEEAPELAKVSRSNPFTVPGDYFEEMERGIQARVMLESLQLQKESGFIVHEDYFGSLPEKIEASLAVEELKEEMDTEGFTVPSGYFEELNARITSKVLGHEPKVRKLFPGWMSYAAAASITVLVAFGFLMNRNNTNTVPAELSAVPEQEIVSYLQLYADQMDSQVIVENLEPTGAFSGLSDDVSAQELKYYLEDTSL